MMGLNPEQLKEIADAFNVFDMDKDGVISLKEMEGVLKTLGHFHSKNATIEMFKEMDKDGSGNIEFEEFLELIKNHLSFQGNPLDELQTIFGYFDLDNDGFISVAELKTVLGFLGENGDQTGHERTGTMEMRVRDEEIVEMIRIADKNNDGKVDLSDFLDLMNEIDDINLTHNCKHTEDVVKMVSPGTPRTPGGGQTGSLRKRTVDKSSRQTFRRNFTKNDNPKF